MAEDKKNKRKSQKSLFEEYAQNVIAGLTVSFVALTLGAAFGLLSGRGAFAGMISAAVIALITSLFGGTRVQCSGPTGPMTAVSAVLIATAYDTVGCFPGLSADHFVNIAIILGGVLMMVMGILRLGRFITLIPNVVVSGFMNGIALIIWLDQIKKLFGLGGKIALTGSMMTNFLVAFLSAVLVFTLPYFLKKYLSKYSRFISATLFAVIIMTIACDALSLDIEKVRLATSISSFRDFSSLIISQWPSKWSFSIILAALPFAIQLSILGYLDTLMTSLVIDKLTKEKTKQNKELFAQGIANGVAGTIGGIPGAQATIRSVLIVKEKATMRLAGVLVGIFVLIEIILFQNFINLIPQAVFTGILIKVGWDVFDLKPIYIYIGEWVHDRAKIMHNFFSSHNKEKIFVTNREFLMIIGTTLLTVFFDLNTAVGVFTAVFYLHNKVFVRKNPMRDLKPLHETDVFSEEV